MQEGVDVIIIDNGKLSLTVVPTRGMNIFEVKCGDVRLGWDSPIKELVHPSFVNLEANGGTGWLYSFNEWLSRCGMSWAGHPGQDGSRHLSLHGRLAHIPASEVELVADADPPYTLRLRGLVHECMFKGCNLELLSEVALVPGSATFSLRDVVTNRGRAPEEMQMLYHANFGQPLLGEGSLVHGMVGRVEPFDDDAAADVENWDRYLAPGSVKPGGERLYCIEPFAGEDRRSHFVLQDSAGLKAVRCSFYPEELPCLSLWKNEDALESGYVTGLEPGTSFAHNRAIERKHGRVPKLSAGAAREFNIEYEILSGSEAVAAAVAAVEAAKKGQKPTLHTAVIAK